VLSVSLVFGFIYRYISPEHVPVQYGGLSVDNCECNSDFTHDDIATEITIKPTTKQTVEIIVYEVRPFCIRHFIQLFQTSISVFVFGI